MQEIHKEQNKDRTNITVFPFCLRLQCGSIWHYFCQWPRNERKKRELRGSWERPPTRLHSGTICPPQDSSLWVEAGPLAVLWPSCPTPSLFLPQRDTQLVGMGGDLLPHSQPLSSPRQPFLLAVFSGAQHKHLTFSENTPSVWREGPGSHIHTIWLHLLVTANSATEETTSPGLTTVSVNFGGKIQSDRVGLCKLGQRESQ